MAELFRKSVLDKLSSPEQLDKAIVITAPSFWIALCGGAVIVVSALLWGILGKLPVNVESSGIYVSGDGTNGVYSEISGVITEVTVSDGDVIEKGDVIAYVGEGAVTDEISSLTQRIEAINKITLDSTNDVITADNKAVVDVKSGLIALNATYEQNMKSLTEKQAELAAQQAKVDSLKTVADQLKSSYYTALGVSDNTASQLDYSEAQTDLATQKQLYQSMLSSYQQAQLNRDSTASIYDAAVSSCETLEEQLAQLEQEVEEYNTVVEQLKATLEELKSKGGSEEEIQLVTAQLSEASAALQAAQSNYSSLNTQVLSAQNAKLTAEVNFQNAESALGVADDNLNDSLNNLNNAQNNFDIAKANYEAVLSSQKSNSLSQNVSSNEYNVALSNYNAEKSIMESLKQTVDSLKIQTDQSKEEANVKKEQINTEFSAVKASALSQLQLELDKYTRNLKKYEIVSTQSGTIQEIVAVGGAVVTQGTEILKVKTDENNTKQALCYIPVTTGKKIEPGMEVMIYPTTVSKQEYGHMVGVVKTVSSYVTSQTEMKKKLGDDTLVSAFLKNGPVVEVVCEIKTDETTASGYYWSSKKGASLTIAEGTMLEASIITETKAPITMVIPYLKQKVEELSKPSQTGVGTAATSNNS